MVAITAAAALDAGVTGVRMMIFTTRLGKLVSPFWSVAWTRTKYVPSVRGLANWTEYCPLVATAALPRTLPDWSMIDIVVLGSYVPTRWGCRTEVMWSPLIPVSSACERLGTEGVRIGRPTPRAVWRIRA